MRAKGFARLALVAGIAAFTPVPVPGPAPEAAWAQEAVTQAPPASPPATSSSGLPRRPPDPRTLAEYWPVFAGFSLTWAAIVGYLVLLGRPFSRTARAIHLLEERRAGGQRDA
jgi:hypothetical protein